MTKEEVLGVLSRLQAGRDVESILNFIKAGNLLLQLRTVPETR